MWFTTLRGKIAALVTLILIVCVGGTYFYIIEAQTSQFVETTKDQAAVLTHAIVKLIARIIDHIGLLDLFLCNAVCLCPFEYLAA